VNNSLAALQPSFRKLEWPVFVYSFLLLLRDYYIKDAEAFFNKHKREFESLHEEDIKTLSTIRLPAHVEENRLAKLYLEHKYRVGMTLMPFSVLMQFLVVVKCHNINAKMAPPSTEMVTSRPASTRATWILYPSTTRSLSTNMVLSLPPRR
jgi:hypothetical protein